MNLKADFTLVYDHIRNTHMGNARLNQTVPFRLFNNSKLLYSGVMSCKLKESSYACSPLYASNLANRILILEKGTWVLLTTVEGVCIKEVIRG